MKKNNHIINKTTHIQIMNIHKGMKIVVRDWGRTLSGNRSLANELKLTKFEIHNKFYFDKPEYKNLLCEIASISKIKIHGDTTIIGILAPNNKEYVIEEKGIAIL